MTKLLRCRDVGFDCDAEVRAESQEELLAQVSQHAREVHGIEQVPDEVVARALAATEEVDDQDTAGS